ncbi:alpha/beta fold hydrolase [Sporobolomyces koalae]|uniref:alpha/beta fold hydrolase n=1 Tax=Sporobolomyces koalae TaxID=500713 RepID=UPI003171E654
MPFKQIDYRELSMFYLLNPDPRDFVDASHDNLPQSRPLKEGLPILVLIHAAGASIFSWYRQMSDPRLAQNFNIFAVDCRFHGLTTGGERKTHTLENSAECVIATLDEMNFESYHVFGDQVHGSVIATWIAIKRADKIKSLLLSSPGWLRECPEVRDALLTVSQALFVNKPGRGGDDSGTLPSEPLDDIVAYFISGLDRLADARQELKLRFQQRYGTGKPLHDSRWLFQSVIERTAIPPDLMARISCPVLILRGSEDNMVSPERATEEWRRALINAKGGANCHVIAGAPSLISLSDPNIVNRIVMRFLLRVEGKD